MNKSDKFYPEPNNNVDFKELEEGVLNFWNENKIFEQTVEKNTANGDFVFFDGPPFANGLPHYGHLLAGYIKDTVARYQTMRGKRVIRKFGWDCHGLPAEMGVEKENGINGRKAIEEYGIDKFNDLCGKSVLKYVNEWKQYVNRSGRWVDFDNGYKTMDLNYMESVIWIFKQLYEKGLLYEDFRVMPYSWRCQTPLSNFETKMDNSYRERADKAITVKFTLESVPNFVKNKEIKEIKCLAWTTTPWTLPSNLALAVNRGVDYVLVKKDGEYFIIGKNLLSKYKKELGVDDKGNFDILQEFKGELLVGLKYKPLMNYLTRLPEVAQAEQCFTILNGDYVTIEEGTGIVHTAPGFGEDDNMVCKAVGIPTVCPVDDGGCFTEIIKDYKGQQVFDANDPIILRLKEEGTLLKTEQILHNYPHCWRTDTPLIYRAISSWYVKVTDFKDSLIKNNQNINWIPEHVKNGRFGKWLEGARDWAITRNRFWGCPVPVWKSDNPQYPRIDVYGSLAELERDFGVKVDNLHRPFIDNLIRKNPDDPTGKSMMRRVSDVLDCWFESGSMPYAQLHYPFENAEYFKNNFPADFITEGDGQIRGWFYTLLVLGCALFDKNPFTTCISFGTIVDEEGKKLSKRWRNYVDPQEAFDTYGSDAIRWLMLKSPALNGEEFRIDKHGKDMKETLRLAIKPVINSYNFFCLYANSDNIKAEPLKDVYYVKKGIGDRKLIEDAWIVRKKVFIEEQGVSVEDEMDKYDFDADELHYVVYREEKPIAVMRVWLKENSLNLQRFSVLKEFRRRGIASDLLRIVIGDAFSLSNVKEIEFHAQAYLKDFYRKFGFETVGEEFEEVGIKHVEMRARIDDLKKIDLKNELNFLDNAMDIYILSKLKTTVNFIKEAMDSYEIGNACRISEEFFEILNNWYIRRNKNRFWKSEKDQDKQNAYNTLYTVLTTICEAMASLMPFTTEYIWKGLVKK
jgi:isoleucyl-tRNA synthetase